MIGTTISTWPLTSRQQIIMLEQAAFARTKELIAVRGRFFTPGSLVQPLWFNARVPEAAVTDAAVEAGGSMHDPPLEPRDEAVFLLTAAAEIEHALMVQYLYAAYSVRVSGDNTAELKKMQDLLFQITREEMGHLATVQNLLHLIGGPLNFNREHSPYASEIYPFRFNLQPLTLDSLAKYVIAESPADLPDTFPSEDKALLEQLQVDAKRANDGREVQHVGSIFARLKELFQGGDQGLQDQDFRLDTHPLQARFEDWGFTPGSPSLGEPLIIESFDGSAVDQLRSAATEAIRKISAQGEGFDPPIVDPNDSESHFERFFDIYKRFRGLSDASVQITWPVAENPNTTPVPIEPPDPAHEVEFAQEALAAKGRITHPRTRAWAQLFNLRYRLLLGHLSHFLRLSQELYVTDQGPQRGERTARGLLLIWTFNEMRRLKKIAGKLVQMPQENPPGDAHAGPTFELPYTLNLPDREADRWRMHLDVSRAAVRLIKEQLQPGDLTDNGDDFLDDLVSLDEKTHAIMQSLASGAGVPEGSLPTDFRKTVLILEEAVRGFDITPVRHDNFWGGKTRDAFLGLNSPTPPVAKNPQGGFNFDPDASALIQRLEGTLPPGQRRMPRFRPPVPPERIGFIRDWISDGCRDNTPAGEIGLQRERQPAPEHTEGPLLSFAADIKGLFREEPDRKSMLESGPFDLHRFEDVRDHADGILARLKLGDMPCDKPWPADRVAIFQKWIGDGKLP
jgi:hypothetical protein